MSSLHKLFRSTEEQVQPEEATVTGNLPNWLQGSYLRVGPGIFDLNDFTVNHWCDGFAVVYKFRIREGKVEFSKKIVESNAYKKACSVGRPVFTEMGTKAYTDTNKNIFQKLVSNVIPELTDNVGVNVFKLGSAVYLVTETSHMKILNTDNLNTVQKVDLSNYLTVNKVCSHFFEDPDGTAYTLGYSFTTNFKCQIIKIPPSQNSKDEFKKAHSLCTLPNRLPKSSCYSHSFGMTENYIVYIEQPYFVNNIQLMTAHIKGKSLLDCMQWNTEESTRFILIDKKTGSRSTILYESKVPFFFLHIINCYEKGKEVVVDVIGHDSAKLIEILYLDKLREHKFQLPSEDQGAAHRYIIPLADDIKVFPEMKNLVTTDHRVEAQRQGEKVIITGAKLTAPHYDLPAINTNYIAREYKYFYAAGLFGPSKYTGCIIKVNVATGAVLTWKEHDEVIPGEAAFVPRPGATEEDDGVLVAGVTDTREGKRDFLVVLNAKTLQEIARAEVDAHVPHLIHALFLEGN